MWCARLDHFVRFNFNGMVSRCGHMVNPPEFSSLDQMNQSVWLQDIKSKFAQDQWPAECSRCQDTEKLNGTSIRLNANKLYETRSKDNKNYLQVGGVLDNICNSACQTCVPQLSTKIGSLMSKDYVIFDNSSRFNNLPQDAITDLDINGGEPSASKNYKNLLSNLPRNLKTLRVNTNGAILIPELKRIQEQGIEVTVTMSFDGTDLVHDYVRWPIEWSKLVKNLFQYREYGLHSLNLWTTVSALNVGNMKNIFDFVDQHGLDHSYAFLKIPEPLDVKYKNSYTLAAKREFESDSDVRLQKLSEVIATDADNQLSIDEFIRKQDTIRNINIKNFIKLDRQTSS